jgi:hypothetical protein
MLPGEAAEVPLGEDDALDVLLGEELLLVLLVEPEGDVDGVVAVEEVELVLPIVDEPDAPAELSDALVSVQLSSVPWRQPVTVTVLALPAGLLTLELLVVLEPLVPVGLAGSVLCVPLCAATLTAKAHANATPVAGPNTRFMCSSSWFG